MSRFVKGWLFLGAFITSMVTASELEQRSDSKSYLLPQEVNSPGGLNAFQSIVSAPPVPFEGNLTQPIQIALIYPSADLSDFWVRNYHALISRLKDLGINYHIEEYSSRQIEHTLQTRYTDRVLEQADHFDYVIFGPSELSVQAENIQRLSASSQFKTYVWAFHTPVSYTH
jgi:autoinducer 2-binding protein LuxP